MTALAAGPGAGPLVVDVELEHARPLALAPLRRFVAAHVVPGLELHDPETGWHRRAVRGERGPALVEVGLAGDGSAGCLPARVTAADPADLPDLVARLRRFLDLDADPGPGLALLGADPLIGPLVRARPGLRVPGALDGGEAALLTVLGQQVSLGAARTFAGRLVSAYGRPAPGGLALFPDPAVLAAAGPDALRATTGVTGARSRTLHVLAGALRDGLRLEPGADPVQVRRELRALPGVGPWTADYVALRALGDRDAFLAEDLVLRRALGVSTSRAALALAEAWRPLRAEALLHLWTREVFA